MYTEDQLRMVAKALGEYVEISSDGKLVNGFLLPVGLDYFLTPYASRLIQDFLISEEPEVFSFHLTSKGWSVTFEREVLDSQSNLKTDYIIGEGDTPQEALLDACIQYLGGKNEKA